MRAKAYIRTCAHTRTDAPIRVYARLAPHVFPASRFPYIAVCPLGSAFGAIWTPPLRATPL